MMGKFLDWVRGRQPDECCKRRLSEKIEAEVAGEVRQAIQMNISSSNLVARKADETKAQAERVTEILTELERARGIIHAAEEALAMVYREPHQEPP